MLSTSYCNAIFKFLTPYYAFVIQITESIDDKNNTKITELKIVRRCHCHSNKCPKRTLQCRAEQQHLVSVTETQSGAVHQ